MCSPGTKERRAADVRMHLYARRKPRAFALSGLTQPETPHSAVTVCGQPKAELKNAERPGLPDARISRELTECFPRGRQFREAGYAAGWTAGKVANWPAGQAAGKAADQATGQATPGNTRQRQATYQAAGQTARQATPVSTRQTKHICQAAGQAARQAPSATVPCALNVPGPPTHVLAKRIFACRRLGGPGGHLQL